MARLRKGLVDEEAKLLENMKQMSQYDDQLKVLLRKWEEKDQDNVETFKLIAELAKLGLSAKE